MTGRSHSSGEGTVRVELSDGILRLTLDRPASRNALHPTLIEALAAALAPRTDVRALFLRGEGEQAFCAGFDLMALQPPLDGEGLPDDRLGEVLRMLEDYPVPTVACINGASFGAGLELACACDFRVATRSAQLCLPPAKLGIVYAPEGLWRVQRLVGPAKAKRLFLTGQLLGAEQALAWGLVDELHDNVGATVAAALALADLLAANAPLAVQGMKQIFRALGRPALSSEEEAHFRTLRREAFASEDLREGRAAFLEKRPASFSGR